MRQPDYGIAADRREETDHEHGVVEDYGDGGGPWGDAADHMDGDGADHGDGHGDEVDGSVRELMAAQSVLD